MRWSSFFHRNWYLICTNVSFCHYTTAIFPPAAWKLSKRNPIFKKFSSKQNFESICFSFTALKYVCPIGACWKLDRECHVDFCMFLTPHELNFELLMKTQKRKMKRNAWKLSCILLFWNTVFIRSCPVVYVLYRRCSINFEYSFLDNLLNRSHYSLRCRNFFRVPTLLLSSLTK